MCRVVLAHKSHLHQRPARGGFRSDDALGIGDNARQGFLAQDESASLDRHNRQIGVRVIGRCDDHTVEPRICRDVGRVGRRCSVTEPGCVERRGGIDIGDHHDLDAVDGGEILDVLAAHATRTDHTDLDCHD